MILYQDLAFAFDPAIARRNSFVIDMIICRKTKGHDMALILSAGISIFGIPFNPALLAFLMVAIVFGGLNILEFKRFD